MDRRALLLSGASVLAACATNAPAPAEGDADEALRALVTRLSERSRRARPFLLRRFDARGLSPDARVLYESLLPGADADAALSRFGYGEDGFLYAVSHRNGAHRRPVDNATQDETVRDINRETGRLEANATRGVIAPDFAIDAALVSLDAALARSASDSRRTDLTEALTQQRNALVTLRPRAQSEPGVWRFPDGEAYYSAVLACNFGAAIDPREAHERALERCRVLQTQADAILRLHGLSEGDVGARLRALSRDPSQHYEAGQTSRDEALAEMRATLATARVNLAPIFPGLSTAQADVRALPPEQEANGTQGRRQGGDYFIDLGGARPRFTLPSIVHHELLPGHIYQASFERDAGALPLQLRYCSGYSEGWAIYAEQAADDAGAFVDAPLSRLGCLQWMLFRMARIVADTGMHALRWSRAQAITEMRALQGDSIAFVSIEDDVARMAVQPGFAAAQGLAALHIAELRERTQRNARGRFDLARFHRAMLRFGPLSPPGLEAAAREAFAD